MIVIKKPVESDVAALSSWLNQYQETTMFIRNNLYHSGISYQDAPFHGDYFCAFENKQLTCVLVHYWNGNVMMQAENLPALSALVEEFELQKTRPIAGIIGEDTQANFVIDKLDLHPSIFAVNYQEKLFSLAFEHMMAPQAIHSYCCSLKAVQDCDRDVIKQWLVAYNIEALGDDANNPKLEESVTRDMQDPRLGQNRWVLFVDDTPVSLCGFNATLPNMVQIGPVYTPPSFRNKSFARIAVYLCLKQAAARQVKRAILFTNDSAAIRAYQALGFNQIGYYRLALLKS